MTSDSIPFPYFPATARSAARRKPVYGIGINDSPYVVEMKTEGARQVCPYYNVWRNVLQRCYHEGFRACHPTYANCVVVSEWHTFSNFRMWMATQNWQGMQLDKDILFPGNKVYGPGTCVFVDQLTNKLLGDRAAKRGVWPIGVSWSKEKRLFQSRCGINGKSKYLGRFTNPADAHAAYLVAKEGEIRRVAALQSDVRVRDALLSRVI